MKSMKIKHLKNFHTYASYIFYPVCTVILQLLATEGTVLMVFISLCS